MNNKNLINNNLYSTSDLSLAAVLCLHYPIKAVNKKNQKKAYFIFEKDKNFDLLLERYWHGDLKVDPQQYFNNLRILKNRIYNS